MREIVRTETLNGYEYTVYDTGTIVATGQLQNETAARNSYNQRIAGGKSRQPTDQGGHIVAASHNGSPDRINITAQDAKVNTRDIRAVERDETSDDSFAAAEGTGISRDELYKALEDDNIPNDYDHSWTGHETQDNQMEGFGSDSSCNMASSSESTGGANEENSCSSTMSI